ncbi:uncharacterized protein [Dermacentor albipictus]|uniref:uncharacterized protein isoform X4 n=1 Tax=Dermacentor albipictus TaxID=60249 RepID=UPI0031FBBB5F
MCSDTQPLTKSAAAPCILLTAKQGVFRKGRTAYRSSTGNCTGPWCPHRRRGSSLQVTLDERCSWNARDMGLRGLLTQLNSKIYTWPHMNASQST